MIYFKLCPNDNYFNPEEKRNNLKPLPRNSQKNVVAIRFLSKLIGTLVAAFAAVTLGPFYYRALEMDKAKTLQQSNANYNKDIL